MPGNKPPPAPPPELLSTLRDRARAELDTCVSNLCEAHREMVRARECYEKAGYRDRAESMRYLEGVTEQLVEEAKQLLARMDPN